jgi:hypothetical protein
VRESAPNVATALPKEGAQLMDDTRRGWSERWSPLGGLLFVIGVIVILILNPDSGETPQR